VAGVTARPANVPYVHDRRAADDFLEQQRRDGVERQLVGRIFARNAAGFDRRLERQGWLHGGSRAHKGVYRQVWGLTLHFAVCTWHS